MPEAFTDGSAPDGLTSILAMLTKEGLLKGKTLGVDAITLEANATLRSIVRKDSGDDYREYLKKLTAASGIETPTKEELIRFDRPRKDKKMPTDDWKHRHDPDARIGMTKRGDCDMIHKCETATDLDSGAVPCVTLEHADCGDSTTVRPTLATDAANLDAPATRTSTRCWRCRFFLRRKWSLTRDVIPMPVSSIPVGAEWT